MANNKNNSSNQLSLLEVDPKFPTTRFQGSKLKIVDWIWDAIKDFKFDTSLDAFGGTGSVSYKFKKEGKQVTYNDNMEYNYVIGKAIIENNNVRLDDKDLNIILTKKTGRKYPDFISNTFYDIYFTDAENQWLDYVLTNIGDLECEYKKALAYFSLFQACIIKRPFNLFHRKNLYLRFSDVKRNFGNKVTWDKAFEDHFVNFVNEANNAVFSNGLKNISINHDAFDIPGKFDLVYIDTPYISKTGSSVDYHGFYHFLEGLLNYSNWNELIDHKSKHKKLKSRKSIWNDKNQIHEGFDRLFKKFSNSILVVSYRSDGIPQIPDLCNILKRYKKNVNILEKKNYKYVLSHNHSDEVLLIGR